MRKNKKSWDNIRFETNYIPDDEYNNTTFVNQNRLRELMMMNKKELFKVYMNSNDKQERELIEDIKHKKTNGLPFIITRPQSEYDRINKMIKTSESEIEDIDINEYDLI